MPVYNPEFEAMRVQMQAWFDREKGGLSAEESKYAQLVLLALTACAQNKQPGALLKGLGEYTEALSKARADK